MIFVIMVLGSEETSVTNFKEPNLFARQLSANNVIFKSTQKNSL